jgi:hypothetical protein
MAYYIFLKSLRRLEEFRKNPHVKIPPKSPSTNFQSLGKFKNPILIQKFLFFLIFGPADPAARLASGPASPPVVPSPQAEIVPAGPSSPRVGRVFVGNKFSFLVRVFLSRPPLPRLSVKLAPLVSCVFPTAPANPGRFLPSPPATPRRLASDLVMPGKVITPRLDSPSYSHSLTSHQAGPSSMALKPLTPALTAWPPLFGAPPTEYKRRAPSPSVTAPLTTPISLSPCLSSPLAERHRFPILHRRRPASTVPLELR